MPNVCLMKQNDSDKRISKKGMTRALALLQKFIEIFTFHHFKLIFTELSSLLSFTNEAQFLLIGSASLEILFKKMMASNSLSFSE